MVIIIISKIDIKIKFSSIGIRNARRGRVRGNQASRIRVIGVSMMKGLSVVSVLVWGWREFGWLRWIDLLFLPAGAYDHYWL